MLRYSSLGQVLGDQVRWIDDAMHLVQRHVARFDLVLEPEIQNVEMSKLSQARSADDADGGAGICMQSGLDRDAKVHHQRHESECLGVRA